MRAAATALLLAVVAASACRRSTQPPAPSPRPAPTPATAASETAEPETFAGPETCVECHADEAARWLRSGHVLAARSLHGVDDAGEAGSAGNAAERAAPRPAGKGTRAAPLGGGSGGNQAVPPGTTHVLGGRRREAFVVRTEGAAVVSEHARSIVSSKKWTKDDDLAHARSPRGSFAEECAGCHPIPSLANGRDVPMSPPDAATLPAGVSCEHCHGPGAAHAADAREAARASRAPRAGLVLEGSGGDRWGSCGPCHAAGTHLRREDGPALRAGDRLLDHVLPATLATSLGPSPAFRPDGRPAWPHGFEVQALEQSACAREGGATCVTCHDPHGPGEAAIDPDASCVKCHAAIAASGEAHARHPVTKTPVPTAAMEPHGPARGRLPGCVDCHLPAMLPLGEGGLVRDHAIDVPTPDVLHPDACTACHADWRESRLVAHLDRWFADRSDRRKRWTQAFATAIAEAPRGTALAAPSSVPLLAAVLDDAEADAWTRSSAAVMLGEFGRRAQVAAPSLLRALSSEDPLLLRRASRALGHVAGGGREELAALASGSKDWRVAVEAAAGLDTQGDDRGLRALERLREMDLPPEGRFDATFELGLALLRRNALQRAALLFEEVTLGDPRHVPAWMNLGTVRAGLGDEAGAEIAWRRVLELAPRDAFAQANLEALEEKRAARRAAEQGRTTP